MFFSDRNKHGMNRGKSINSKTTIATACKNREANLRIAIQSWIEASPAKIIICDWGSDEPLTHESLGIPQDFYRRVEIHRVEANHWILTWAFNEALSKAKTPFILKLDCDHVISKDFFESNIIAPNTFSRGHWRTQRSSQQYINGAFMSCSELLQHVGFYDERITSYGWDDSDLYERLYEASTMATTLARGSIHHLDQDEKERTNSQDVSLEDHLSTFLAIKKTKFLIERNRILTRMLWPWNGKLFQTRHKIREQFVGLKPKQEALIEFATIKAFQQFYEQLGQEKYQSAIDAYHAIASQAKPAESYRTSSCLSASILDEYTKACHANDDFRKNILRLGLLAGSTNQARLDQRLEALLLSDPDKYKQHSIQKSRNQIPKIQPLLANQPKLYIDAQHGLGNRLRAIASAAAIAEATQKELVIVWEPDHHCQAKFSDLFNYHGPVIEASFIKDSTGLCDRVYNYMTAESGACKNEPIDLGLKGSLYLRSAFTLNAQVSHWDSENAFLRSLRAHDFIQGLISAVHQPNDLSVHVRMAGGKEYEHLAYENQSNWTEEDHREIAKWRQKSHFSVFFKRIDQLLQEGTMSSIFLAADLPETYDAFRQRYGDKVNWLPRNKNDRSTEQLRFALADAILLSRSKMLLGSTWSSFSELALRFADPNIRKEMSGIDF
jgi:glycosyltransferase involved in cell wall biosynthesis